MLAPLDEESQQSACVKSWDLLIRIWIRDHKHRHVCPNQRLCHPTCMSPSRPAGATAGESANRIMATGQSGIGTLISEAVSSRFLWGDHWAACQCKLNYLLSIVLRESQRCCSLLSLDGSAPYLAVIQFGHCRRFRKPIWRHSLSESPVLEPMIRN